MLPFGQNDEGQPINETEGISMTAPKFGYCLPIFANPGAALFRTPNYERLDAQTTLALGQHAEEIGFDSLWVADHLMLGQDEAILEGWTTLSVLGGATSRAKLGMIHQGHYFRAPAITAKMAATLDQLSGGRFIMFYDFGRQEREHRAYHLPYPADVDTRVAQIIEGIELIKTLWTADAPVTIDGPSYAVSNAVCHPAPAQQPHPPIWFGEMEPGLLAACAEFGQGWNTTPVSLPELERRLVLLKAACDAAGRPFSEIEKSAELQVLINPDGDTRTQLRCILDRAPDAAAVPSELRVYANGETSSVPPALSNTTLIGSPDQVQHQVQSYVDAGINHFLLWFLDAPDRSGMDLFAREVLPRFGATLS
jgi:alkanesulfonate monooxygenase SsuD/methylene tetrahydromethanopterin reductase-like flavin-dependent oxidoreductase (luciferase family)